MRFPTAGRVGVGVTAAGILAYVGFCFGFSQYPSEETAAGYAVFVGIASAAAWAAGAVCGFLPTLILPSGFLNLFAAIFAAASLGYLTPAEPFCRPVTDRELRPEWSGNNWFFAVQCQLRVYPSRQTELQLLNKEMSELANELGKDGQTIQQAIARITALERRMEDIKLAPSSGGSSPQR